MKLERLALKGLSSAFPDAIDLPLRDLAARADRAHRLERQRQDDFPRGDARRHLSGSCRRARGRIPSSTRSAATAISTEEFTVDGRGTFRVRLNLDGPKRQSDAVLEQAVGIGPDVTWIPLNDGKRSTFDAVNQRSFSVLRPLHQFRVRGAGAGRRVHPAQAVAAEGPLRRVPRPAALRDEGEARRPRPRSCTPTRGCG
jgi:hypothetical protein